MFGQLHLYSCMYQVHTATANARIGVTTTQDILPPVSSAFPILVQWSWLRFLHLRTFLDRHFSLFSYHEGDDSPYQSSLSKNDAPLSLSILRKKLSYHRWKTESGIGVSGLQYELYGSEQDWLHVR